MPFVRIDLMRGKSIEYRKTIGEIVYNAMRDVIDVPKDDKFQIITEHPLEDFNVSESYLGNHYSKDVVLIQIALNAGRSVEQKKAFYKRIVDDMNTQLNVRPQDVVITGSREGKLVVRRWHCAIRGLTAWAWRVEDARKRAYDPRMTRRARTIGKPMIALSL